mgnify:CR=1 FL=1
MGHFLVRRVALITREQIILRLVELYRFLVRRVADVVAGRRPTKRSILDVCEHLADKPDAADAPLSQENTLSGDFFVNLIASAHLLLGLKRDVVALLGTLGRLLVEHNAEGLLLHNTSLLTHKE